MKRIVSEQECVKTRDVNRLSFVGGISRAGTKFVVTRTSDRFVQRIILEQPDDRFNDGFDSIVACVEGCVLSGCDMYLFDSYDELLQWLKN